MSAPRPQWFVDLLAHECARCGRRSCWSVRWVNDQQRSYACYYHLKWAIDQVLARAGGLAEVVVARLDQ